MAQSRFDAWATAVAAPALSRRAGVRLAMTTGAAMLLGHTVAGETAAAKCSANNRDCNRDDDCWSGKCKRGICKRARGARGCKITQDICEIGNPGKACPNTQDGVCTRLPNGQAVCADASFCQSCSTNASCPDGPSGTKKYCIRNCVGCNLTNGRRCIYVPLS
jgi:hypothetical protein